jgi:hypothetical protein
MRVCSVDGLSCVNPPPTPATIAANNLIDISATEAALSQDNSALTS